MRFPVSWVIKARVTDNGFDGRQSLDYAEQMRDSAPNHIAPALRRSKPHFHPEIAYVFLRSMEMKKRGKDVWPMAVLQKREALVREGLDNAQPFLAVVFVNKRFLAQGRQTGFHRRF